jgi:hypothetical protein
MTKMAEDDTMQERQLRGRQPPPRQKHGPERENRKGGGLAYKPGGLLVGLLSKLQPVFIIAAALSGIAIGKSSAGIAARSAGLIEIFL